MNTQSDQKLPIIGILGDGQLAMMMAQAYQNLGGKVFVFSAAENAPANQCADQVFYGESTSFEAMKEFFEAVDIVTLENEFIDSQLLVTTSEQCSTPLYPDPKRFALIEDKLSEKRFFQDLGLNLAEFFEVKSEQDLLDEPGYLKLAKGGYDGIGTYRVNSKEEALEIYQKIKFSGVILFEKAIDFQKELSMIGVSNGQEVVLYPMVETHQEQGTCRYVSFPSGVSESVEREAKSQVEKILQELGTRGLFAFEYFLGNDNELILNESAPRPHNSGHITLDLNDCSQFENHMRAVAGLELIEPAVLQDSMMMVNLLGTQAGPFNAEKVCGDVNDPNSSVTLYNKTDSKIKRKMGHINLWGPNQEQRAAELVQRLEI
jgi:5-(carboxyamino)imidazole ribonucleotide synthase